MDIIKTMLDNGEIKEVNGVFYLYNSKYYLMYTEKELDENGYVILYLVQIGKEIKNTANGPIDTGYMIGMEISDSEEWKNVQSSITKIVEDKKDSKQSSEIQYLPITMLSTLKIKSRKKFRLKRDIIENYFHLNIPTKEVEPNEATQAPSQDFNNIEVPVSIENVTLTSSPTEFQPQLELPTVEPQLVVPSAPVNVEAAESTPIVQDKTDLNPLEILNSEPRTEDGVNTNINSVVPENNDAIIDYRSRFFEEQEKNKNLELKISELERKLEEIKNLVNM